MTAECMWGSADYSVTTSRRWFQLHLPEGGRRSLTLRINNILAVAAQQ